MYDGVSMDRAYSGSTLIWCKNCPVYASMGEQVYQGESLIKGEDYVIGFKGLYSGGLLTTAKTVNYTRTIQADTWIFHCDDNYPAVYESLCEGYVTDLGAAFGLYAGSEGNRHHDRTLQCDPNNKRSLSTYIGYDWHAAHNPDREVIMIGQYGLQAYYLYTPNQIYNDVGFNLFPLNTGTSYQTLHLYHVNYHY